jgi:hypothetical protein
MKTKSHEIAADVAAYRAIDLIYHSYLTGLILKVSSQAGPQRAAEIVFRTFRRQQLARLGFVCTGQTVDGQPGLEGYYKEWDHDLAPEERLQFSPGERCPAFDPERAPKLPENTWPEDRLLKVLRNYSMEYITSIVPETIAALGPDEGGHLAGAAARLIGMHTFDEVATHLGGVEPSAAGFAKAFARIARGHGDDAELSQDGNAFTVRQTSWRLMSERESLSPAVFDAWNELWVGAALAHDRFMRIEISERRDRGDAYWAWRFC